MNRHILHIPILCFLIIFIHGFIWVAKKSKPITIEKEIIPTRVSLFSMPKHKQLYQMVLSANDGNMNVSYFISKEDLELLKKDIDKYLIKKEK